MTWSLPPETKEEWIARTKAEIFAWGSIKQRADSRLDELGRILESLEEANGGDAVPARAASLRPQPASRFSQSGIAIARRDA